MFVNTRGAVRELGLHPNTLRKYADTGIIPTIRTPSGRRMYDVGAYLGKQQGAHRVCYCRVSSGKQRDDLERQVANMRKSYPEAEIVKDIASGLNWKRKGFRIILGRLLRGEQLEIVVAHRDRLARFGFGLIEFLVETNSGRIVVLDPGVGHSAESELTEDLLAILHHFSCRMHGSRSHQGQKNSPVSHARPAESFSEVVRGLALRVQPGGGAPEDRKSALDGLVEGHPSEPVGMGERDPLSD